MSCGGAGAINLRLVYVVLAAASKEDKSLQMPEFKRNENLHKSNHIV